MQYGELWLIKISKKVGFSFDEKKATHNDVMEKLRIMRKNLWKIPKNPLLMYLKLTIPVTTETSLIIDEIMKNNTDTNNAEKYVENKLVHLIKSV